MEILRRHCADLWRNGFDNLSGEDRLYEFYLHVRFCEDIVRIYGEIGLIICVQRRDCPSLMCMFASAKTLCGFM